MEDKVDIQITIDANMDRIRIQSKAQNIDINLDCTNPRRVARIIEEVLNSLPLTPEGVAFISLDLIDEDRRLNIGEW